MAGRPDRRSAGLQAQALDEILLVPDEDRFIARTSLELARAGQFYLWGTIDASSSRAIVELLHWAERKSRARAWTVWLCSPGGDVFEALAVYAALRSIRRRVVTVALGYTASGGSVVLQAGHVRRMSRTAWLMIHEVHLAQNEPMRTSDVQDEASLMRRLDEQLLNIYAERAKVSRRRLRELYQRRDYWMPAQEALKYGLVDEVV